MKNIFKNNFVKLPLFLLCVGVVCAGSLSMVNSITVPVIEENKRKEKLKAYSDAFKDLYPDGAPEFKVTENDLSDKLKGVGVTNKVAINEGDKLVGYVYAGTVPGFKDYTINFTVSFTDGKYHNFSAVNNQSIPYGLQYVIDNLKDYSITDPNFFETDAFNKGVAGASTSVKSGLIPALNGCADDYATTIK